MIRLLMIIPLLFLCTTVYSQSPVQVFSPNAANLGQYGQVPVNYFNGLPEISIPLTTFKAKDYDLPISLSYHASGNNPNSHPGWTGLGWTLRAGGMINRIVNDQKDEKSAREYRFYDPTSPLDFEFAYYYNAESSQASNWTDESFLLGVNRVSANISRMDYEPDEFQINVGDIQASFYIIGNNKVKIKSKTNANFKVDIRLDTNNSTYVLYKSSRGLKDVTSELFTYISEIVITNNDGTKYYFGGDMAAIEFSFIQNSIIDNEGINENQWRAVGTANSWLLKKIELPNDEIIEFTYEKSGIPIVMSDNHYCDAYFIEKTETGNKYDTRVEDLKADNISFTFIQPSYLRSITSKVTKNRIAFNKSKSQELGYNITEALFKLRVCDLSAYNSSGEFTYTNLMSHNYYMQLDEIVEKNKRIRLRYSDDLQSRLRLLSVTFSSDDGWQFNKYDLIYNSLKLPSYNSKKTDKWGYYNNKYYGNIAYENLDMYRTPNDSLMQAEILTGIIYPTGGKTDFIYEAHNYSRVAEQFDFVVKPKLGTAGGLRIKKIRNTENGRNIIREFEYVDSLGNSSGILSGNHLYYVKGRQHVDLHFSRWWGLVYFNIALNYVADYYFMREDNINQLSTTSGNHVTYSRVVEKLADGSKTIYSYSNHDEFMDETPVKMIDNINSGVLGNSFISKELERGLLLKTEFVNNNNLSVGTEIYKYNSTPERYNDFIKSIDQVALANGNIQRVSALKIYTFYPYLESKTTIVHDTSLEETFTSVTKYEYNPYKLLSKTSTVNSKGRKSLI